MYTSEELIRRIRPLIGHKADQIWASYLASDKQEQTLLNQALNQLHTRLVDDYRNEKIILPPPSQFHQLHGDYPIGLIHYADKPLYPFSLLQKELTAHIGVFGRTGAGKTYFVKGLLASHIIHHKKPAIIFDWKDTYTDLPYPTTIIKPGITPFRFNPLALDDIPQNQHKTYIRQIVELFIESFLEDLKLLTVQGVESLLLLGVDTLLNQHPKITFHDLYQYIRTFKGKMREMDWKTTAENILYKLTTGPLGVVLENPSTTIESLTTSPIVFELSNIGNAKDKSFFIKSLLLRLYYHYQSKGTSSDLIQLIVLEEAHNILLRKSGGHESILERLFREVREFGVGLCVIDQHPSLISLPALGTYCTVAFNLSLAQDRVAMASALNLQHPHYLGKLHSRFAIVKIQDRYVEPFLIKTFPYGTSQSQSYTVGNPLSKRLQEVARGIEQLQPPMEYEKPFTDGTMVSQTVSRVSRKEVSRNTSAHNANITAQDQKQQRAGFGKYEWLQDKPVDRHSQNGFSGQNPFSEVSRPVSSQKRNLRNIDTKGNRGNWMEKDSNGGSIDDKVVSRSSFSDSSSGFSEVSRVSRNLHAVYQIRSYMAKRRKEPITDEELLLCHLYAFPISATGKRFKTYQWSWDYGTRIRKSLQERGIVIQESVPTKNARIKILTLTKAGCLFMKKRGFGAGLKKKRIGIEHRYWQRRLRDQFERLGYTVELEAPLDEYNSVDVVVSSQTKKVAIEVETGSNSYDHITHNIEKCQGKFDGVVSYILNQTKADEMQKRNVKEGIIVTAESECISYVQSILR